MRVPPLVLSALLIMAAGLPIAQSADASREAVVYLTRSGFSPPTLSIGLGDRVRFTVRDRKPHQLAKTSGPASGDVPPGVLESQGSSVTLEPGEMGAYVYVDRLNPSRAPFRLTLGPAKH